MTLTWDELKERSKKLRKEMTELNEEIRNIDVPSYKRLPEIDHIVLSHAGVTMCKTKYRMNTDEKDILLFNKIIVKCSECRFRAREK